jgi:hypothetical protein
MRIRIAIVGLALLTLSVSVPASGVLGIFALLDKVVFEPDETHAERVQLWGVFGYTNGVGAVTDVERGYVYFRLPNANEVNDVAISTTLIRREWLDLKSVAGTDQAIGFSLSGVSGNRVLDRPRVDSDRSNPAVFTGGTAVDLRVRPASEKPDSPAVYRIDTGVTKLSASGNRADLVKLLRAAAVK